MCRIRYFPLRLLALFIALFTILFFGKSGGEAYELRDPENCIFHFTVLSDVHTEAINEPRSRAVVKACSASQSAKAKTTRSSISATAPRTRSISKT